MNPIMQCFSIVLKCVILAGATAWIILLLLPWFPWLTREHLDADQEAQDFDGSEITVLIPARNEARVLKKTLDCLSRQGGGVQVILVDDQSIDGTADIARKFGRNLTVIDGISPPAGWSGKLWAMEQGLVHVSTPLILLLDADIGLQDGLLAALINKKRHEGLHFISLMAELRMENFWERLLMPAFVYFFKLLYPFSLANSKSRHVAAAAGGCILADTAIIREIGGFGPLKSALIDDCTLASLIKKTGSRTWIGLSRSVQSLRAYERFSSIRDMVARTAFTQLHYSVVLLAVVTLTMITLFWAVPAGCFFLEGWGRILCVAGTVSMVICYLPTLRYYDRSSLWCFALPLIGGCYLYMAWVSAVRHWQGKGASWKGRGYTSQFRSWMQNKERGLR